MLSAALQRHPSIRLLVPLVVGIVAGWYLHIPDLPGLWISFIVSWVAFLATYLLSKRFTWLFGWILNICLVCWGYILTSWQLAQTDFIFSDQREAYMAVVKEAPQEKPRTFLLPSDIFTPEGQSHRFLLYVAKDSASSCVNSGDTLLIQARLQAPNNDAMTDGFDYVGYLKRKGVTGTAYVAAGRWQLRGHNDHMGWIGRLQDYRTVVLDRYQYLGFAGDSYAVLSALTTGVKEDLSDELRETYSVAGVSHVLALSGLHIGLIYGFLLLFFMPLWRRVSWFKPFSLCLVIAILWAFAIFTGLSTSVIRSAIMFSIHAIASFREEKPASLHVLALTAFGMLLFRPLWLFDVSFQLSFVAVASIMILQPRLSSLLPEPSLWVAKKMKDILTVSIAAQIGTAPLIILYFHRFSTHFLLSNLLVLPLITLIMYGAVAMMLTTPLPALQQWVANGLDGLINALNGLLHQLTRLPMASIDNLWTNALEVILFYCCIYLFLRYLNLRTASRAIGALSGIWILVSCHLVFTIIRL